jgi:mono/diheme cytochrome c family protein
LGGAISHSLSILNSQFSILLFLLALPFVIAATPPPAQSPQTRGRQIYLRGESRSGRELVAVTGSDAVQVPAAALPCAGCHGYDGRGKPEGGTTPADISADSLRRPSDGARSNNRARPAYDDATLTRAIAMGIDSGRKPLDPTMPRYRMSRDDMRDLLAYLRLLGEEKDPGLDDDAITIGVVLPETSGGAARDSLERLAGKANEDGIYGRKLRFLFASGAQRFAGDAQPFLVIDTTASGDVTQALAEEQRMPALIASRAGDDSGRYTFQLLGGTREAAMALLAHARKATQGRGLLILHDAPLAPLAAAIQAGAERQGWKVRLHAAAWKDGLLEGRDAVLLLGNPGSVLERIAAQPHPPLVLIPAAVVQGPLPATPPALDGRIVVAFPAIPSSDAPRMVALASAAVILNAFEALGREVTREKLVDHLQNLNHFDSGWLPPLTWTATRRIGTTGAYLMTADREHGKLVGKPGWVGE